MKLKKTVKTIGSFLTSQGSGKGPDLVTLAKRSIVTFANKSLQKQVKLITKRDPLFAKDLKTLEKSPRSYKFESFNDMSKQQRFEPSKQIINVNPRKQNFEKGVKHEVFHAVQFDHMASDKNIDVHQVFQQKSHRMFMELGAIATGESKLGTGSEQLRKTVSEQWQNYQHHPGYDSIENARKLVGKSYHQPTVKRVKELGLDHLLEPKDKDDKR